MWRPIFVAFTPLKRLELLRVNENELPLSRCTTLQKLILGQPSVSASFFGPAPLPFRLQSSKHGTSVTVAGHSH